MSGDENQARTWPCLLPRALADSDLGPLQRLLYGRIAALTRAGLPCNLTDRALARYSGASVCSVRLALKALEAGGYIKRETRRAGVAFGPDVHTREMTALEPWLGASKNSLYSKSLYSDPLHSDPLHSDPLHSDSLYSDFSDKRNNILEKQESRQTTAHTHSARARDPSGQGEGRAEASPDRPDLDADRGQGGGQGAIRDDRGQDSDPSPLAGSRRGAGDDMGTWEGSAEKTPPQGSNLGGRGACGGAGGATPFADPDTPQKQANLSDPNVTPLERWLIGVFATVKRPDGLVLLDPLQTAREYVAHYGPKGEAAMRSEARAREWALCERKRSALKKPAAEKAPTGGAPQRPQHPPRPWPAYYYGPPNRDNLPRTERQMLLDMSAERLAHAIDFGPARGVYDPITPRFREACKDEMTRMRMTPEEARWTFTDAVQRADLACKKNPLCQGALGLIKNRGEGRASFIALLRDIAGLSPEAAEKGLDQLQVFVRPRIRADEVYHETRARLKAQGMTDDDAHLAAHAAAGAVMEDARRRGLVS